MARRNPDKASSTFDISNQDNADLVLSMYRDSDIFKNSQRNVLNAESAVAALEKLSHILTEEGIQCRKWQRDGVYRCYLSAYRKPNIKYIEISPVDGTCELVERSRTPMDSTDIIRVPEAIRKWRQWSSANQSLWDTQSAEYESRKFQKWLEENDYEVQGAPIESLFVGSSTPSTAERKKIKAAEFEIAMLKIDAEIKEAVQEGDTEGTRELEQLRSALAQERRQFLEAADTRTEVQTELLDEVSDLLNREVEDVVEYDPENDLDDEGEVEYDPENDLDDEGEVEYDPENDLDDEGEVEYDPEYEEEYDPEYEEEYDPEDDAEDDLEYDPEDDAEDDLEYDPQDDAEDDPQDDAEDDPFDTRGYFRDLVIERRKTVEAEYERAILKTRAWAELLRQGYDIPTDHEASIEDIERALNKLERERQKYLEEFDAGNVAPKDEVLDLVTAVFRDYPDLDTLTDEAIDKATVSEDVEAEAAEPSVIEVDARTDATINRALENIDIEALENEISQTLKQEMTDRGLSRFTDNVHVQKVNGDLIVYDIEGYLDSVPLPKGMTPDQQRKFVDAVKAFESTKKTVNAKVSRTVADALGLSEEDEALLKKIDIPQFRIHGNFLTTYTKRELPGEIDQLEDAVRSHMDNIRSEAGFFEVRAMIQSLLRYDITQPFYQKFLDSLVRAANDHKIFSENDRRKFLPLLQRTQVRARNAGRYVSVAEDISEGIRKEVGKVLEALTNLPQNIIEAYADPDLRQELLDEGKPEIYFERLNQSGLGECVQERLAWAPTEPAPPAPTNTEVESETSTPDRPFAYTFEMEFGELKTADFKRCEDLMNSVSEADNARLEAFAKSVFENVQSVYRIHIFETPLEIEIVYGASEGVEFDADRRGYIKVTAPASFDSSFVRGAYASLCAALAVVIKDLEPELEDDDKDIDGDDLLAEMRIPSLTRPNPAASRPAQQMLTDIFNIYSEKAPTHVTAAYEECLGGLPDTWDTGMYVGESEPEAAERAARLASALGISAHIPYDIALRLDDEDLSGLVNFIIRRYADSDGTNAERMALKADIERAYRDTIAPKYFPEKEFRVVLTTREETAEFLKTHPSVFGESSIDPRRLSLTLGLEMSGKLVAAATVNSENGYVELSRVASDGSVVGAAAYLAGAVIDLGIMRNFAAYSDFGDTAEAYMALLGKGLRPVSVHKEKGRFKGIVWRAGPEAPPASMDIARALSESYAQDLAKSGIPNIELYPKDAYLSRCILNKLEVPEGSRLRNHFLLKLKQPSALVLEIRDDLDLLAEYAREHPHRNSEALTKPFDICDRLNKDEFIAADKRDIARCAQVISRLPDCTDDVRRKLKELVKNYPS